MGKNVQHVQHVKSNVVENGSPKLPNPSVLAEGEIAINFAEGYETLSIKSSSGNIKTFSSDEYYTEQKLGSGFTGVNSGKSVTDVIVENEEIISSALTDLDDRKLDASAITEYWVSGTGENSVILKNSSGIASGDFSVAEGEKTSATSEASHAEGYRTKANAFSSHAEGNGTVANESATHAEGNYTTAFTNSSHAEGNATMAGGNSSHAEGNGTIASGTSSHAEGNGAKAIGDSSHAEGINTTASGVNSHTEGNNTITNNYSEHASGQYNVSSSASTTFGNSGNTLFSVGNGTASNTRHNAFEIRQNGDIYIVNKDGNDVRLQDEIGNIAVDQVLDNTTSASTNPVSSKAVYDAVTDNELVWTNAYVALSGEVSAHTANTEIHVTAADKEKLHTHSNKSALDSITGNVGTMAYENKTSYSSATEVNTALGNKLEASDVANFFNDAKYELSGTTHVINFYNGNTVKATIDADDFIKDGMISAVTLDTKSGTTYLVIEWNTDAGIQTTELNIGDLFEADNYYTKSQTSGATELSTAFGNKADTATTLAGYGITDAYTKSETSGATQISNALGTKVDSTTYNAHTGDTTIHFTTGTVQTQIDNSISGKVNTSDIVSAITASNSGSTAPIATKVVAENELVMSNALIDLDERKLDASAYTPTDLSNYYTKSETSGATEISNALGGKVNSATFTGHTADTAMHFTTTEKTNLDSLATNIAAISGITSTKVSNWDTAYTNNHTHSNKTALDSITGNVGTMAYQNTSSYSSATQVNTALAGKSDTGHTHVSSAVTAMTGYAKAASGSSIETGDTLNQAIGKLEASVDDKIGRDEYEDDMFVIATSLTDLQTNKLDASAYTPTDLSNYYTKSQTSGATEISTALNGKANSSHNQASNTITAMTSYAKAASGSSITTSDTLNQAIGKIEAYVDDLNSQSETVAAALVDLYNKIGDIETLLSQI